MDGRPRLGDLTKIQIDIVESTKFKVLCVPLTALNRCFLFSFIYATNSHQDSPDVRFFGPFFSICMRVKS